MITVTNAAELRERGCVPRVHGNGFIQVDLNKAGTQRLHVWDEDVPRQKVATPIHDHVFDMRSEVIVGTLIHKTYRVLTCWDKEGAYVVYRAQREEGTQNTTLVPYDSTVNLELEQRLILEAASIYTFPAYQLHESGHLGTTATIMEKVNAPDGYGNPRVLVPVGVEPDNEFHRDNHDVRLLWQIIEKAIG